MSKIEMLRLLINQRLTEAAEEIFSVFGRTIAEYEEEICRSKQEIHRQRRLLELAKKPHIQLENSAAGEKSKEPCAALDLGEDLSRFKEEKPDLFAERGDELSPEQESVTFMFVNNSAVAMQKGAVGPPESSSQELEDLELDPQPGPSAPLACSDLSEDELLKCEVASDSGQLDCREMDIPAHALADSYICAICGQQFSEHAQLAKHVLSHQKAAGADKSYKCDICGKRLTRLDGYQKHLRVHTGEKPYSCSECGRRFSDHSNYKRHVRTHMVQRQQRAQAAGLQL